MVAAGICEASPTPAERVGVSQALLCHVPGRAALSSTIKEEKAVRVFSTLPLLHLHTSVFPLVRR